MQEHSAFGDSLSTLGRVEVAMRERGLGLHALERREAINQATGIIMVRRGLAREEAVDFLLDQAQLQHRELHDVARRIVDSLTLFNRGDRGRTSPPGDA